MKDAEGNPVEDSVYNVTFRIYNVASGGTSLWNETLPCTTAAGLFNAIFSNVNLPFDEDYWLELEVGGEISSTNYAANGTIGQTIIGQSSSQSYIVESGFWVGAGRIPLCFYTVGDVNGSDNYNGLDITYGVVFFKGGAAPLYECECTPGNIWYVSGDVNGSCNYNGLDITYGVNYLKGGAAPFHCMDCPPAD
ncbi:MAG: hypothetical protein JSU85_15675 [Candidatus Zixiibacteriota bacterium]|nr:MAG: hypothetical protein JSU85_15675 [candidate division Zixibacteria bacterium]